MCEFQKVISHFFRDAGKLVARWPLPFLAVPVMITMGMLYGIYEHRHKFTGETSSPQLSQFLPDQVRSGDQVNKLAEYFPPVDELRDSYSVFDGAMCHITLLDKGEGNTLRPQLLHYAKFLFRQVEDITVEYEQLLVRWRQLCYRMNSRCSIHPLFNELLLAPRNFTLSNLPILRHLHYPVMSLNNGMQYDNAVIFGGVSLRPGTDVIHKAKTLRIPFLLEQYSNLEGQAYLNYLWQVKFIEFAKRQKPPPDVELFYMTSISWGLEIDRNGKMLMPVLPLLGGVLLIVSIVATCTGDWVTSKPMIGFCGLLSATFAVIASIGTLFLCEYPFTQIVLIMPFLVLSISIDSMFLLLGAWRNTLPSESVEDRLSQASGSTAVSITITALTDGLSFSVGSLSPFPAVRIFCTYCALAILFSFLYQMSFFLACMALSGRREAANRHCLTLNKVLPRGSSGNRSQAYQVLCAGGVTLHGRAEGVPLRLPSYCLAEVFSTHYSDFLLKLPVQVTIIVIYLGYLTLSAYGISNSTVGLDIKHLVPYDSNVAAVLALETEYYSEYGPYAYITIEGDLDYHDPAINRHLLNTYDRMTRTEYTNGGQFWLKDFMEDSDSRYLNGLAFKEELQKYLASAAGSKHRNSIYWLTNDERTFQIVATRMLIRLQYAGFKNATRITSQLKRMFKESKIPGNIYAAMFILVEQQEETVANLIQGAAIAVGIMVVITAVFIPKLLCAIWVAISIVSINVGVIGILSLWGVYIDIISMITILMSIGFSVDFVAHITYHYLASKVPKSQRIHRAMRFVGLPILQSAISTVVGVLTLAYIDAYIIRTFVKTVILVIVIGMVHGIVFLPVIYSLVIPDNEFLDSFGHYAKVKEYLSTNIPRYFSKNAVRNMRMNTYFIKSNSPVNSDDPLVTIGSKGSRNDPLEPRNINLFMANINNNQTPLQQRMNSLQSRSRPYDKHARPPSPVPAGKIVNTSSPSDEMSNIEHQLDGPFFRSKPVDRHEHNHHHHHHHRRTHQDQNQHHDNAQHMHNYPTEEYAQQNENYVLKQNLQLPDMEYNGPNPGHIGRCYCETCMEYLLRDVHRQSNRSSYSSHRRNHSMGEVQDHSHETPRNAFSNRSARRSVDNISNPSNTVIHSAPSMPGFSRIGIPTPFVHDQSHIPKISLGRDRSNPQFQTMSSTSFSISRLKHANLGALNSELKQNSKSHPPLWRQNDIWARQSAHEIGQHNHNSHNRQTQRPSIPPPIPPPKPPKPPPKPKSELVKIVVASQLGSRDALRSQAAALGQTWRSEDSLPDSDRFAVWTSVRKPSPPPPYPSLQNTSSYQRRPPPTSSSDYNEAKTSDESVKSTHHFKPERYLASERQLSTFTGGPSISTLRQLLNISSSTTSARSGHSTSVRSESS